MKTNRSILIGVLFFFSTAVIVISCQKDDRKIDNQQAEIQKKIDYLISNYHIPREKIAQSGEYLVIDGDMLIRLDKFWENYTINPHNPLAKDGYTQSAGLCDISVSNKIYVNTNGVPWFVWILAVKDAVAAWNGTGNIVFKDTSYPGYMPGAINVSYDTIQGQPNVCAHSLMPFNGLPGDILVINASMGLITSPNRDTRAKRALTIIHELGHAIGMGHVDISDTTAATNGQQMFWISGLCDSGPNTYSVMQANNCGVEWGSFTYCDTAIYHLLYP